MSELKIRWRLYCDDEKEPTTRQRGVNVYRQLQQLGFDADKWDGREAADIIVLQYSMRLLDEALATGATVVADINDQVFAKHHAYHQETMAGLARVHAVVAGSPRLGQNLQRLHPTVRVIEEAVDGRYLAVERKKHQGLNVVWMGMHDNIMYFREIDPALEELAKKHDFTVHFVCPPNDGFGKSNADKVKTKPYPAQFHAWTMDDLLEQMAVADLAVVPLFQQEWTWCKCANKMLSFMAAGLPVVASRVPSYVAVAEPGTDSFLAYSPEEWYAALDQLFSDSGLRSRIGKRARLKARQYSIERIADQWVDYFRQVGPK